MQQGRYRRAELAGEIILSRSRPTPMPGLEHQHRPERILPVSPAGLVLVETLAHIGDIEQATHLESLLGEELGSPLAERSPDPLAKRNAEALLRALEQCGRHVALQHLPQDTLALCGVA